MLSRAAPLLVLLHLLCVYIFPFTHKFSSSVHPCDDFETFVCNEAENGRLGSPFYELRHGYFDMLRDALVKEDDVIIREFKKVLNVSLEISVTFTAREPIANLKLAYHNKSSNSKGEIDATKIRDYSNLLHLKHILENGMINENRMAKQKRIYDEAKEKFLSIMQNTTVLQPAAKAEYLKRFETKRLIIGPQQSALDLDLINATIAKIQTKFFDMKTNITPRKECNQQCIIEHYYHLLQVAYNDTMNGSPLQVKYPDHLLYGTDEYFEVNAFHRQILIMQEGSGIYANSFYVPPSGIYEEIDDIPYGLKQTSLPGIFLDAFFTDLVRFIIINDMEYYERLPGHKCFEEEGVSDHVNHIVASLREEVKMIDTTPPGKFPNNPFNDMQWYLIFIQSNYCEDDASPTSRTLGTRSYFFKQNPTFQKAFGCKPGHRLYTAEKDLCMLY
ncbi:hypothetical protein QR680_014538 [Steinernema hermaphroditum]|uniref:Peptidase M13 C-terminal domain-containing protein n=1 Tax=Steinernema hermaphroditum TaxID=289476 RepID=A0AA39I974_9BILA|nr:hypothetical protein QR680_014538 [Steinernema hermaphroditum]